MVQIATRVPRHVKAALSRAARARARGEGKHVGVSDLVREAIETVFKDRIAEEKRGR